MTDRQKDTTTIYALTFCDVEDRKESYTRYYTKKALIEYLTDWQYIWKQLEVDTDLSDNDLIMFDYVAQRGCSIGVHQPFILEPAELHG